MEGLLILVGLVYLLATAIRRNKPKTTSYKPNGVNHKEDDTPEHKKCEQRVSHALRNIDTKSYVVFDNLILRSLGNTSHTEIDHVVVSPYGIFCIETKSDRGVIYGGRYSKSWKKYLGGKQYEAVNSLSQNFKHVKALEMLLGNNLRAKIHSYAVYPNVDYVKLDGNYYPCSIDKVIQSIDKHKQPIYSLQDCERILKSLAYASSKSESLRQTHIDEVKSYLLATAQ